MKNKTAYLALLIIIIFSCKKEEKTNPFTIADFQLSTNKITHNKPVTITYNGEDKKIEGNYYLLVHNKAYPQDINFKNNKATLTIPDSITAIAINLKADGAFLTNNKQGYIFAVVNNKGETLNGSQSSIESYKLGSGRNYDLKGDEDKLANTLEADIKTNPELKDFWGLGYLNTILKSDRKKGNTIASSMIAELSNKKELSDNDYFNLNSIYTLTRKNKLADSIAAIAITKYPKGKIKRIKLINSFYDAKSLKEKETIFNTLETDYGTDSPLSYFASSIATQKFKAGDQAGFNTYADKIKSAEEKAGLYNSIAWEGAESGKNLALASKLSKSSLNLLNEAKKDVTNKPAYYTENQYLQSLDNSYKMFADTYALILFKSGNLKEAIKYQEQAVAKGNNSEINDRFVEFLVADKQYVLAAEKAKLFLSDGKGSSKMKAAYKTAHTNLYPNANDFGAIIASIDKINKDKELAELKKSMLDEEAPQFTLNDLNGNTITLADLKGKTVILDFWATWCGPCKASFPGMQQVVEKYKNNENVVLLFVDTFEDGKDRVKKVSEFIKDNNYDFQVLIDNKIKDSDKFNVASQYNVTGIPTKIIIGPNGRIKFKAVGYSGNNDKLKQELDLMIDLLKS